ncbi:ABC transporter permease [Mycetocola lacteus]|uniref:ABC transporter permease n=1 Tax=Mycetocola lacteus TaxID=76637 RepID=A0A3L7AT58_9MICO|nr:ABC transporter permease [Mycetocola lacteus]RLP83703.1 ABC transporter permease [Mycetocola lacteus]
MARYVLRRLIQAVVTLAIVVSLTFVFGRLSGSPAAILLTENAPQSQIDALNHRLGFDLPIWQQYLNYMGGVLHGDFGDSYRQPGVPSMQLVFERIPASFQLGFAGLAVGLLLALIAAVSIHLTGRRSLRTIFLGFGSLRQAIPDFFFGLLLVLVFSVGLGVLPSLGNADWRAMIMPVLTIATGQFVVYTRLMDNALSEQSVADYTRTAYARGERHGTVVLTETLPNALLPVLTVAGINLGTFLGGLVIVENVFAWPGLGQLMLGAVYSRDFPVVQSALIIIAVIFVVANLLVDLIYGLVDPRVRLS